MIASNWQRVWPLSQTNCVSGYNQVSLQLGVRANLLRSRRDSFDGAPVPSCRPCTPGTSRYLHVGSSQHSCRIRCNMRSAVGCRVPSALRVVILNCPLGDARSPHCGLVGPCQRYAHRPTLFPTGFGAVLCGRPEECFRALSAARGQLHNRPEPPVTLRVGTCTCHISPDAPVLGPSEREVVREVVDGMRAAPDHKRLGKVG